MVSRVLLLLLCSLTLQVFPDNVDTGNQDSVAPIASWPAYERTTEILKIKQANEDVLMPCVAIQRSGIFNANTRREEGQGCWEICREESILNVLAPWLCMALLVFLLLLAVFEARNIEAGDSQDSWAITLQLAHRMLLQAPLCAIGLLFLCLLGPGCLVLNFERGAVCLKAISAAYFGSPLLPVWLRPFWAVVAIGIALLRFLAAEAIGSGTFGCFSFLCCKRRLPTGYELRRPRRGCSGPVHDADGHQPSEASNMLLRARVALSLTSMLGTALALDLAALGQPILASVAIGAIVLGARESAQSLRLNRAEVGGRIRDVACPVGSDGAMLLQLSSEMGYPMNELLEKMSSQACFEASISFYIAVLMVVSADLPHFLDLGLAMLTAGISLLSILDGMGSARETASAEMGRYARRTMEAIQLAGGDVSHQAQASLSHGQMGFRGSLIQFQDFNGRKALMRLRLRFVRVFRFCEVLPLAVGLSMWALGGYLTTGYLIGVVLDSSWRLFYPPPLLVGIFPNLLFHVFRPLAWPVFGTFCSLRLSDPTRDYCEHEHVDHLLLPVWSGLRSLFIVFLWVFALFRPECRPFFLEFTSLHSFLSHVEYQRLAAWIWIALGGVAAILFPINALSMNYRRYLWMRADWSRLARHQVSELDPVPDILNVLVLYPEWTTSEKAADYLKMPLEDSVYDKLAALDIIGAMSDLWNGRAYADSEQPNIYLMLHETLGKHHSNIGYRKDLQPNEFSLYHHVPHSDARSAHLVDPYDQHHHQHYDPSRPLHHDPYDQYHTDMRDIRPQTPPGTSLDLRTQQSTSASSTRRREEHVQVPTMFPVHVQKDKSLELQVPMMNLYDPHLSSFDIFFGEASNGTHLKFLVAQTVTTPFGTGLQVYHIGLQDTLGHKENLVHCVSIEPFENRPGVLKVMNQEQGGVAFGTLETTQSGSVLLKHKEVAVLLFEADYSQLHFTSFPVLARPQGSKATDRRTPLAEAGPGLFGLGSRNWNFKAAPGSDAILLISCMLAIALLSHESDHGRHF